MAPALGVLLVAFLVVFSCLQRHCEARMAALDSSAAKRAFEMELEGEADAMEMARCPDV